MFRNAATYNAADTVYHKEAHRQWEFARRAFGTITGRGAPASALGIFDDTAGRGATAAAATATIARQDDDELKAPTTSAAAVRAALKRRTFPRDPVEPVPMIAARLPASEYE